MRSKVKSEKLKVKSFGFILRGCHGNREVLGLPRTISTIFLFACLFICLFVYFSRPVFAATPTSAPTPTGQVQGVDDVRKKVQEIVQEKIAKLKLGQRVGYSGVVVEVNNETITLKTDSGEIKAETGVDTKYTGPKKQSLLKDIKNGDNILVMGYAKEEGVVSAVRIVVFDKPKTSTRKVVFGKVSDISADENVITVKNDRKLTTFTVEFSKTTVITKKVGNKVQKVTFDKIAKGDWIVAIGTPSLNNDKLITAKIAHVIPGLSKPSTTPSTTASPTVKPTKILTPKPTIAE